MNGFNQSKIPEDAVAIVGMACKWPGDATSPSKLWDLLLNGRSGYCPVPKDRFNVDAFYHPDRKRAGSMFTKGGYFLNADVRDFDPAFFGITPAEATELDPQQRKILETVFECFESAGHSLDQVSGSNTGCYVGNFTSDMLRIQTRDPEYSSEHRDLGMGLTILSNRVNYTFNLRGPSLTLDTACSSSLYALHLACVGLRVGDCDAAIVAGTNLIFNVDQQLTSVKLGVLSPTSMCHTFDASADGYARGEGVGVLYVKRLADAIKDRDTIRAVIRGTAINTNGKGIGMSTPSKDAQIEVIRKAYHTCRLNFAETGYFEMHGTGTPVGDPIEVEAVGELQKQHNAQNPLLIGSIKPNLGHSEAASGIASVMKVVLALEKKMIPPTIGINKPNPKIDFESCKVKVVTEPTAWPENLKLRASVNSFGYGGANAHLILEAVESVVPGYAFRINDGSKKQSPQQAIQQLLVYSGNTDHALTTQIEAIRAVSGKYSPRDLSYTLALRRSKFFYRGFSIEGLPSGQKDSQLVPVRGKKQTNPVKLAFIFTGQGAQWPGMFGSLFEFYPSCHTTIRTLDSALAKLPKKDVPTWTLEELSMATDNRIHEPCISQPLCTALQLVVVALLQSWNVTPSIVVGHSSGEIGAAAAAGLLSPEQAIIIAYYRGLMIARHSQSDGAMLAVGLGAAEAQQILNDIGISSEVVVACINSPHSVTISGKKDAIETLQKHLKQEGIFARVLRTHGSAYHSAQMKAVGPYYQEAAENALKNIPCQKDVPDKVPFMSSVDLQPKTETLSMEYWRHNLESPVLFDDAVSLALSLPNIDASHLLEVGPHSALAGPLKQIPASKDLVYLPTVVRGENAFTSIWKSAGEIWLKDYPVDIETLNSTVNSKNPKLASTNGLSNGVDKSHVTSLVTDLPTYPWTYNEKHWTESTASQEWRHRQHPRHDLLGSRVPGISDLDIVWRNVLKADDVLWLSHHKIEANVVVPAAGQIQMAIESVTQHQERAAEKEGKPCVITSYLLRHVSVKQAFVVPDGPRGLEVQTTLRPLQLTSVKSSGSTYEFKICSRRENTWIEHCTGKISTESVPEEGVLTSTETFIDGSLTKAEYTPRWYDALKDMGLVTGFTFQGLSDIETFPGQFKAIATTNLHPTAGAIDFESRYALHPAVLDTCMQLGMIAVNASPTRDSKRAFLPVLYDRIKVYTGRAKQLATAQIRVWGELRGLRAAYTHVHLLDKETNRPLMEMTDIRHLLILSKTKIEGNALERYPYLRLSWKPDIDMSENNELAKLIKLSHTARTASPIKKNGDTASLANCAAELPNEKSKASDSAFGRLLDLVVHKSPSMHILEYSTSETVPELIWLDKLSGNSVFAMYSSYVIYSKAKKTSAWPEDLLSGYYRASASMSNGSDFNDALAGKYDLIIYPELSGAIEDVLLELKTFLKPGGKLLARFRDVHSPRSDGSEDKSSQWHNTLIHEGFSGLELEVNEHESTIFLSTKFNSVYTNGHRKPAHFTLIHRKKSTEFEDQLEELLGTDATVVHQALHNLQFEPSAVHIMLSELNCSLWEDITEEELENLKQLISSAQKLLWITTGGGLVAENPFSALTVGLLRTLSNEYPGVEIFTLNLSSSSTFNEKVPTIVKFISQIASGSVTDHEYVEADGLLYVSRAEPDRGLNSAYNGRFASQPDKKAIPADKSIRLDMGQAGVIETLYYRDSDVAEQPLSDYDVELEVKATALNAKDVATIMGSFDTKNQTLSVESSGIVRRTGSKVTKFKEGDHCTGLMNGHFSSILRRKEEMLMKIPNENDYTFAELASFPLAYSAAIYGLKYLARLKKSESIIIHSGAGSLGIAAITIAQSIGAEIFVTVGSEEKRQFLKKKFGLSDSQIFHSRNNSFVGQLLAATNGVGVDVALNTVVGDLLHETWNCMAPFGRFVETSKRDIIDNGRLDMTPFHRDVNFFAFDLSELENAKNPIICASDLFHEVETLFNEGTIQPIQPIKTFTPPEIETAVRYFMSGTHMGKVIISHDWSAGSLIRYQTPISPFELDSGVTYLLVGCLGGIGRSLVSYMVERGARNLCFLSRSGTAKPQATRFVQSLRTAKICVDVVQGDVTSASDVERALESIPPTRPVRGVVHAAMVEMDSPFYDLTTAKLQAVIQPKFVGAMNLHKALLNVPLDFFVMTSSASGAIGIPTQGAYAAANAGLDALARHRHKLGLPATALALGAVHDVGFLQENSTAFSHQQLKGITFLKEEDILDMFGRAMQIHPPTTFSSSYDPAASSYILTGLEVLFQPSLTTFFWLDNPKFAVLKSAMEMLEATGTNQKSEQKTRDKLNGLLAESFLDAIRYLTELICAKLASSVGLSEEQIDEKNSLTDYGMASLTGAELKSWFFKDLGLDLPYFELLKPGQSMYQLAEMSLLRIKAQTASS